MIKKYCQYVLVLTCTLFSVITAVRANENISRFTNCLSDETAPKITKEQYQKFDLIAEIELGKNIVHGGYCSLLSGNTWTVIPENLSTDEVPVDRSIRFIKFDKSNTVIKEVSAHEIFALWGVNPTCELLFASENIIYSHCTDGETQSMQDGLWSVYTKDEYMLIDSAKHTKIIITNNSYGQLATLEPHNKNLNQRIVTRVSDEQAKAIAYLYEQGIVTGSENNDRELEYYPQNPINRAEFLKILTIAANLEPKTCTSPTFTDTDATAWYMPSLERAYCHDLVQGYGDGTFKPEQSINAAEMYKVVTKAFNLPIPHGTSDIWYSSYERALQSINAIPESIKSHSQFLTRGEMAEVVYKVMQYKK